MKLEAMKGSELVAIYNAIPGVTPVTKFKDRATALKRIQAVKKPEVAKPVIEKPVAAPKNEIAELLSGDGIPDFLKVDKEAQARRNAARKALPAPRVERSPTSVKYVTTTKAKSVPSTSKLAAEFSARGGTFREKLLIKLEAEFGKQVPMKEMCIAVYGNDEKANVGPLKMCLKGAVASIEKDGLPYKIIVDEKAGMGIYKKK
jgi:hypothetical protein